MLTASRARELLRYEPESGQFYWLQSKGRMRAGGRAGRTAANGYVQIKVDGKTYYAHRLAWLWVHGFWPERPVDHIDCTPGNNQLKNLRLLTHAENIQNQRRARADNGSTGLLGAHFNASANRFQASITTHGKRRYLGVFRTAEEAHEAYLKAKRELHSSCSI